MGWFVTLVGPNPSFSKGDSPHGWTLHRELASNAGVNPGGSLSFLRLPGPPQL